MSIFGTWESYAGAVKYLDVLTKGKRLNTKEELEGYKKEKRNEREKLAARIDKLMSRDY